MVAKFYPQFLETAEGVCKQEVKHVTNIENEK